MQYLYPLLVYKRHFNGLFGYAFFSGIFNRRKMVIFRRSLHVQCIYHLLFNGYVLDYNDLYSSNLLLVRRKAYFTSPICQAKDCGFCNFFLSWVGFSIIVGLTVFFTFTYAFYDKNRTLCIYVSSCCRISRL